MSLGNRIFQEQAGNTFFKVTANRALSMGVWDEDDLPDEEDGAEYRGALVQIPGASGVGDKLLVMRKNAGNAYEWARVLVGHPDLVGTLSVFNIRDYGAKGDGTTNDHTAVASAITAANSAGGGVVYFPEGTYLVNGSLGGAATKIAIKGDGRFVSKIKLKDSGNTHIFDISGNQWHFEDIGIDGNDAGNSSGHGVRIAGDYHSMARVYIHDTVGYGIANSQSDTTSLRYADYNNVILVNTGTDSIDIKDTASANVGNRLTNILVISPDRSATGAVAAIDCRGPVHLENIVVLDVDSSNGAGVRFRSASESTGPVGGRRSTLVNFYVAGDGVVNASGVAIQAEDVSVSNGTVVGAGRGVTTGADGYNAAVTNVTTIDCTVSGFDINQTLGATLTNCRAAGAPLNYNVVGDDTSLIGCVSRGATTRGVDVAGDRTILQGCRFYASSGTALRFQSGADNSRITGCDFTGQSGGTLVTDSGSGNVFRDNIGYVTRNAGVTSVADGGTISHGLVTTPTKYGATTTTADEYLAITAVSSTTLTVAITKHDGTAGTTANVAWWAEV